MMPASGESSHPFIRLLRGSASYGLGTFVVRSYTVLLLPVYLAYLTPADFGVLAITDLVSTPLASVLNLCLDRAVTRFYYVWDPADRSRQLGAIWITSLISATAITGALIWSGPLLLGRVLDSVPFYPFLTLACLIAAFRSTSSIPQMILRVREQAGRYATAAALSSISGSLLILYFIVVRRSGAKGVLLATLINEMAWCAFWSVVMLRWSSYGSPKGLLGPALRYSLPLLPADLAYALGQGLDRLFLQRYVPLSDLGLYSVAARFGRVFQEVNQAAKNAWIPLALRLGSESTDSARTAIGALAAVYVAAFTSLAFVIAVFSQEVVVLFATPEFLGAAKWIPIFIVGYFGYVVYFVALPGINLSGRNEYVTGVMVAYVAVSATLSTILVPRFGLAGGAIAFAAALQALGIMAAVISSKLYPIPFPFRQTFGFVIVAIVVGTVVVSLPLGRSLILIKAVVCAAYLLGVAYFTRRGFPSSRLVAQLS